MATIQQELKPQPRETPDDDTDEMYEEEPRRRAWGAITSVILALALVFVGYQWNQAGNRAEALGAQVNGLRAEAETQRLRAEDAQRQIDALQKRLVAMSAEKDTLAERVVALEKSAQQRPAAAKAVAKSEKPRATKATAATPARPGATPVAGRPPATKRTP
jgi:Tfp pilus assembly protein FimV